ncbi:uncharacterized protein SPSK_02144 [Sporothrix schenckii 1099-18]|uniref:Uncharacterized protein n=1 Tax=Sporothrix schenckii 1099-18 TaxID=1397361 RepID=A0A0F2MB18_SPOSC|nr:uncharacterized protein SPSK_02144 [Sporothrix schenckii 1099-18]KJR86279.1 hypothetical protein SPSK_02144 [Sporothrix schenckii 1099-18]
MSGREAARKVVDDIAEHNGYIPPQVLTIIKTSAPKDEFDRAMKGIENLRRGASESVKTLAENLYSSSAKFVFEMLQNFDDNKYERADGPPSVAFCVYPDRIVASCNEDGFTAENVKAISSLGKSSKNAESLLAGEDGYAGEKGIGFKSVFMAAEQVHIQSGDYSFMFKYRKGDSGIGMMTPVWTEHDDDLDAKRTHITLTLRRDGGPDEVQKRREIIEEQFRTIHDSILLFMKKLTQIRISFHDAANVLTSATTYTVDRGMCKTAVKKSTSTFDSNRKETVVDVVRHFIIFKHVVSNLAPNENRKRRDGDAPVKNKSSGVVVLGFPVDGNDVPVIANQYLYAFLPVKQLGFKFLIHADFVTPANREDIVLTSQRNRDLAVGIKHAFLKAVLWCSQHNTLAYQWMRYLPRVDAFPWEPFWVDLISNIRNEIQSQIVMVPTNKSRRTAIADCQRLPPTMVDANGDPLLADLSPGCYLSQQYKAADLDLLTDCGLRTLSIHEWLDRLAVDLAGNKSFMRTTTSEDWHTRVAELLVAAFKLLPSHMRSRLTQLELIPVQHQKWVSVESVPVFYPNVEGMDVAIPNGLGLNVVDIRAAANPARKRLFDVLGVKTARPFFVRSAIFDTNRSRVSLFISDAVAHLQFLYRTQHVTTPPHGYSRLHVVSRDGSLGNNLTERYLADGSPYGADILLPNRNGAPGLPSVFILHDEYLRDPPTPPTPTSQSWKDWLYDQVGVRRYLPLVSQSGTGTSAICKYVAKHRPDKFAGFLIAAWGKVLLTTKGQTAIVEELNEVEVRCKGGRNVPLRRAYLPIPSLEALASNFLEDEFFPWLELDFPQQDGDVYPQKCLAVGQSFGLGHNCSTIAFLLDVLRHIKRMNNTTSALKNPKRIYELYIRLEAEIQASEWEVRTAFQSEPLIFVPGSRIRPQHWTVPKVCVWQAPANIVSKTPLARVCAEHFQALYTSTEAYSSLQSFFSTTLEIRNADWVDLVNEISHVRRLDTCDIARITSLYIALANVSAKFIEAEWLEMKNRFDTEPLICGFGTTVSGDNIASKPWCYSAQCLWTSATPIPGKITLDHLYPELEDFFVKLGVGNMTVEMVYEKLTGPALSVDDAKQTIMTFNELIIRGDVPDSLDPSKVHMRPLFPVKLPDGDVRLFTGQSQFAIPDRHHLLRCFSGKANILDFDLETNRTLVPFFEWVGVHDKYLSRTVHESTCVPYDDGRPITSPDRDVRRKARALTSLAIAYGSPRVEDNQIASFYATLKQAKTIETDKITSQLELTQDDGPIAVRWASPTTAAIQYASDTLKIYVAQDAVRQDVGFIGTLPKLLCEWIMMAPAVQLEEAKYSPYSPPVCWELIPPEMVEAVRSVLCAKPIAMKHILEHHGFSLVAPPDGRYDDYESDSDDDSEAGTEDAEDYEKDLAVVLLSTPSGQDSYTSYTGSQDTLSTPSRSQVGRDALLLRTPSPTGRHGRKLSTDEADVLLSSALAGFSITPPGR